VTPILDTTGLAARGIPGSDPPQIKFEAGLASKPTSPNAAKLTTFTCLAASDVKMHR